MRFWLRVFRQSSKLMSIARRLASIKSIKSFKSKFMTKVSNQRPEKDDEETPHDRPNFSLNAGKRSLNGDCASKPSLSFSFLFHTSRRRNSRRKLESKNLISVCFLAAQWTRVSRDELCWHGRRSTSDCYVHKKRQIDFSLLCARSGMLGGFYPMSLIRTLLFAFESSPITDSKLETPNWHSSMCAFWLRSHRNDELLLLSWIPLIMNSQRRQMTEWWVKSSLQSNCAINGSRLVATTSLRGAIETRETKTFAGAFKPVSDSRTTVSAELKALEASDCRQARFRASKLPLKAF